MKDERLDYPVFVADALRQVVRRSLEFASRRGLPGEHHFFITFQTTAPGVTLSARMRAQHPDQMTIVLQHQYDGLAVNELGFSVNLSFGGRAERLTIPFAAVMAFVDPSVNFGLPIPGFEQKDEAEEPPAPEPPARAEGEPAAVVQLHNFRKK